MEQLWHARWFVAEGFGTLHRARKPGPCAVCIDDIERGDSYWRIDGRRWCAWCVLLFFDVAPEDCEEVR